jgi:AcrR family transcriptional regulator
VTRARPSARPTGRPAGRPADAEGDRTRALLVQAAVHRFARQGLAHTTLREVAETAGLSAGTLHHYFGSKNALYHEAYLWAVHDQLNASREACAGLETVREKVVAILDSMSGRAATAAEVGLFLLRAWVERNAEDQEPLPIPQEVLDFYDGIARAGVASGELADDQGPQIIDAIRCMTWGISAIALTGRQPVDGVEGMKLFVLGALEKSSPSAAAG